MPEALIAPNPASDSPIIPTGEEEIIQSPLRLAVRRFRRHRLGMLAFYTLIALYLIAIFAGFFAPYEFDDEVRELQWAPPNLRFRDANGFSLRPFVHPMRMVVDENLMVVPREDASRRLYLRFFVRGAPYSLGIANARTRLFGVDPLPADIRSTEGTYYSRVYLMGADLTGRDIFSRICYGARISMSIGLIGVFFVLIIGLIVGGASGYFGGRIDDVLYSFSQMIMLLPGFYLLLMLRFVFPPKMDSAQVYFAVILILSLVGWPGFAIVIRGMVKSIIGQDFIQAARAIGLHNSRIIGKHVLPNTIGYTVVAMTLRIPGYILGEAALSILGLGIMEPTASWGNMLEKAMNIAELDQHPWVLWPGVFIFIAVICFNLVGDGLRDAVDPRMHKA
jgi:peptide/nickel transport system permease protein